MDALRRQRLILLTEASLPGYARVPRISAYSALRRLEAEQHPYLRVLASVRTKVMRDVANVEENGHPPLSGPPEEFENYLGEYVLTHVPAQYRGSPKFWALFYAYAKQDLPFLTLPGFRVALSALTEVVVPHHEGVPALSAVAVFELFPRFARLLGWLYRKVSQRLWGLFVEELMAGHAKRLMSTRLAHDRRLRNRGSSGSPEDIAYAEAHKVEDHRSMTQFLAKYGLESEDEVSAFEVVADFLVGPWSLDNVEALLLSAYAAKAR